ncbi:MAG TPA: hypothetical protein EYH56_02845 [Nanoarchaeota archaeon]|nr:hypothetical protein [Nanoarchaeota archaeon]
MKGDNIKKLEEKFKEEIEILGKRMDFLEESISQLYEEMKKISQAQKIKELEERISELEDLEMLDKLEILKINEILKKGIPGGISHTLEPKLEYLEKTISKIEKKLENQEISSNKIIEINVLSEDIENIRKKVEELEKKICDLEKALNSGIEKIMEILKKLVLVYGVR